MSTARYSCKACHLVRQEAVQQLSRPTGRRCFSSSRTQRSSWSGQEEQDGRRNRFDPAIKGGVVGGGLVALAWYTWHNFFEDVRHPHITEQPKNYLDFGAEQFRVIFREITPGPTDEVIRALKEVADEYSPWIPGGREFVEKSFSDLQRVRKHHETEVNEIVRDTYDELRDVSNRRSARLEAVNATWYILSRRLEEISSLAGDVAHQILESHPEMRDKLDCSFDQLRQLCDRLGPGAKREVDETFSEVSRIVKQGVDASTADDIRRKVQAKAQEIRQRSDRAWSLAMEQLQPALERNPRVKRIVDENLETLRQGRAKEVAEKIRQAVMSGSNGEFERYIKDLSTRYDTIDKRDVYDSKRYEGFELA
ncbi:hypothetical protein CLAFUW4_11020 [Fulvia fulva]|uniref:Uncharacterized protein n=1 Tax=Passalora fulva TaxID=5499 RepID=A0A9Q8URA0_PASFU|nr:uncharacterized protein CLAFUR5_10063 [Fulvia fulva]KAK4619384.1 hypothetical protein CLAFUR4_11025 [Fulvia fulva]KAK4620747.1 hypothetical protein CLAFUR0_11032 [Fulvia fulva]UJO19584.1 hypothetical protein CLAFUR5_10063 [Fulvia fulva]WPV17578.1 hypothetical protein CLAFUW4_11020 [Fulvia fulva]WPV32049.1 hypothetical protein CLAFUW7_11018 [Fulvia fulva]